MICNYCEKVIDDDSVFCKYCGTSTRYKSKAEGIWEYDEEHAHELHYITYDGHEDVCGKVGYLKYCFCNNFYYDKIEDCYYVPLIFSCIDSCGDVWQSFAPRDRDNYALNTFIDAFSDEVHCLFRIDATEVRLNKVVVKYIDVSCDVSGDPYEITMIVTFVIDYHLAKQEQAFFTDSKHKWITKITDI